MAEREMLRSMVCFIAMRPRPLRIVQGDDVRFDASVAHIGNAMGFSKDVFVDDPVELFVGLVGKREHILAAVFCLLFHPVAA